MASPRPLAHKSDIINFNRASLMQPESKIQATKTGCFIKPFEIRKRDVYILPAVIAIFDIIDQPYHFPRILVQV